MVIDNAAQVVHAENVVGEGSATRVRIVAGPGRSGSVWVDKTEDLKSFEYGWEGYLERGGRVDRFWSR